MKRLLVLLILLLALPAYGQQRGEQVARLMLVGGGADPCAGYLICQGFEGTGYDNSETWTESVGDIVDEDYTTALSGSQSLRIRGNTASFTYSALGTTVDPVYVFLRVKVLADNASTIRFISFDTNGTTTGGVRLINGWYWGGAHGSVNTQGPDAGNHTTIYYVWVKYQGEVGAGTLDGIVNVKVNTSGDYDTAVQQINITTGDDNDKAQYIWIGATSSWDVVIDTVLVSGTESLIMKDMP